MHTLYSVRFERARFCYEIPSNIYDIRTSLCFRCSCNCFWYITVLPPLCGFQMYFCRCWWASNLCAQIVARVWTSGAIWVRIHIRVSLPSHVWRHVWVSSECWYIILLGRFLGWLGVRLLGRWFDGLLVGWQDTQHTWFQEYDGPTNSPNLDFETCFYTKGL